MSKLSRLTTRPVRTRVHRTNHEMVVELCKGTPGVTNPEVFCVCFELVRQYSAQVKKLHL